MAEAAQTASATLEARKAALDALARVLDAHEPLDTALDAALRPAGLAPRDRAFARLLLMTALRRNGELDALIGAALDKPLPRAARAIRHILALGLAQLLMLGTAPHAAVDTSVRLAAGIGGGRFKGLVNAVLRRMGREGAARLEALDGPRLNTPDWLWDLIVGTYGEAAARRIAEAHAKEPPLDLTLRDPVEASIWVERMEEAGLTAISLPGGTLRIEGAGRIEALPGYDSGAWWVQDAAAALPARLLIGPRLLDFWGRRALDLCAAPGGKTLQLVSAGARVTAVDRSAERLALVARNLGRLGLAAELIEADGRTFDPGETFDRVLLDAPCTSTGTLRRHPDVAYIKGPGDAGRLAALQDALLARAGALTAPGGILLYAVCSLDPAEGEARIEAFLESAPVFRRLELDAQADTLDPDWVTGAGDLRTLSFHLAESGGMDGFYAARLQRLG